MKKLVIGIVLVGGAAAAGAWGLSGLRLSNYWLDGRAEKAERGDLVIPVTASGTVEPNKIVEIKSKASGKVQKIYVVEGQMVRAGARLVELDPVDEQRNVDRAKADLDRATAAWEQAKIRLEENRLNRPLDTKTAEALVAEAQARYDQARLEVERLEKVTDRTDLEWRRVNATAASAKALLDKAQADLSRARNNEQILVASAEQDVAAALAVKEAAQKTLDDAKQRLSETLIAAPADGMVATIRVREGEVIQSGTTALTGGTSLMSIADISQMYIVAQVDEADIGSVRRIAPEFARPGRTRQVTEAELLAATDPVAASRAAAELAAEASKSLTGQRVKVTVEAYRDEAFEGVIERILPEPVVLQNVTTFNVRIRLLGEGLDKLMRHTGDVEFTVDRVADAVRVKNEALYNEGDEMFVYVPKADAQGRMRDEEKRPVQIGATDGTYTQIRSGLEANQEYWVKRPQKSQQEKDKESRRG